MAKKTLFLKVINLTSGYCEVGFKNDLYKFLVNYHNIY